jgi:hypothetical protein
MKIQIEYGIYTQTALTAVNRLIGMCELYLTLDELHQEMANFDLFTEKASEIKIIKASDHISVYYANTKKQLLTITE